MWTVKERSTRSTAPAPATPPAMAVWPDHEDGSPDHLLQEISPIISCLLLTLSTLLARLLWRQEVVTLRSLNTRKHWLWSLCSGPTDTNISQAKYFLHSWILLKILDISAHCSQDLCKFSSQWVLILFIMFCNDSAELMLAWLLAWPRSHWLVCLPPSALVTRGQSCCCSTEYG